ncbi:DUF262 domain-containing protein [Devosia sp.]|uniref:DUF262 domain-containing protein n=1 Tax=Devosia sp. TaxID=1871048 RepID=UPI001ACAAA29|nr:DUF262 domain-containing protein [Devosia sp.]MBN9335769.1 DUF262 domain-containing protein [Devosia sp.]
MAEKIDEFEEFEELAPLDQQESEEDLPRNKMGDPSQSVLFNTDWTVATIVQQIERGNINLDPDFQRRSAWDSSRRSQLIESLIIGLPIPNIVLAESKEGRGKFIVIDGKQRLSTIFDFMSKETTQPLKLNGLNIRTDLNGKSYDDLKATNGDDANFFENASIRTIVIRNWPSDYFLYVIFDRLNSGSLPLSPQELRKALQPGPLLNYIDTYLENSAEAKNVLGIKVPDRRMRDSEIVLRYIAFETGYPKLYEGDFKDFLDRPVIYFNSSWENRKNELDETLKKLDVSLYYSSRVFDDRSIFRKWNGENFERRINRALFDAIIRYFSDERVGEAAAAKAPQVVAALQKLCTEDAAFKRSIELTTKSTGAVETRMRTWGRTLADLVGGKFEEATYRVHM